jgi:hypothetical protein
MAAAEELKLIMRAEAAAAMKELKKAATEIKKTRDSTKSLAEAFKDQARKSLDAKSALTQLSSSVAGGLAIYSLAAKSFQAIAGFVRESTEAYRAQDAAERMLAAAARNNPYLDKKSVDSLKEYASELQKLTNTDDALAIKTMASLESLQLTEEQIKAVMSAAADYAAVTGRDIGTAAQQLAITFSGQLGTLGRMIPALKNLSKEQLAAGGAIEIFTKQYGGMAAAMAETDAGQIERLANAWVDFKEQVGRDAEKAFGPWRRELAGFLEDLTEAKIKANEGKEARDAVSAGAATLEQRYLAAKATLEIERAGLELMRTTDIRGYRAALKDFEKQLPVWEANIKALETELKIQNELNEKIRLEEEERNRAEAAATAAADAEKERNDKAEKLLKSALDGHNSEIAKLELEARLRGEAVTAQERLNVAQKYYIDLISNSKGLVTEQGPSAQSFRDSVDLPALQASSEEEKRLEQITDILEKAKKAVDEYGMSKQDLNLRALENSGATWEEIQAYITYEAELTRLGAKTKVSVSITESMTESLKEQAKSMAASGLIDMFAGMGEAMASNADIGDAAGAAIMNFASQCVRQISSLAMTAGLRILIEEGTAGLPTALGLFALGGVAGFFGGMLGGRRGGGSLPATVSQVDYKKYISDPIVNAEKDNSRRRIEILKEQLKEEKRLRDEHVDKLEEEFDEEYAVLKDLWDRNIIGTDEFQSRSAELREKRDSSVIEVDKSYEEAEEINNQQIEAEKFIEKQSEAITDLYNHLAGLNFGYKKTLDQLYKNATRYDPHNWKAKEFTQQERNYIVGDARNSGYTGQLAERAKADYSIKAIQNSQSQEEMNEALRMLGGKIEVGPNASVEKVRKDKLWMLEGERNIYAEAAAKETDTVDKILYEGLVGSFTDRINKAAAAMSIDAILAARSGADFTTSGPQMLLVGDNPGGRERVQVTPLGSPNRNGPRPGQGGGEGQTVNIYITGSVYGVEDLYMRLNAAGRALERKGRL